MWNSTWQQIHMKFTTLTFLQLSENALVRSSKEVHLQQMGLSSGSHGCKPSTNASTKQMLDFVSKCAAAKMPPKL